MRRSQKKSRKDSIEGVKWRKKQGKRNKEGRPESWDKEKEEKGMVLKGR